MFPSGTGIEFKNQHGDTERMGFPSLIVRLAFDQGVAFEDLSDASVAFAKSDAWVRIRNSSERAMNKMLERALNHLFPEPRR